MRPSVFSPTGTAVRFQMGVLHALGLPATGDHRATRSPGGGDAVFDISDAAVQFGDDIARYVGDP